jgi:ABC-2 type transport system ATP-binding protein
VSTFVSVANLSKSYNGAKAVDNLSFTIPQGIIFGFLGPNGAGKTTTISMLSGLFPPDEGEILVGGQNLSRNPLAAKALMGVVPQEIALYGSLSARENLHFWGKLYGLTGVNLKTRTEEVLELVGLKERASEPVKNYSGGMKRRINIAAGLLHRPKLLLLDEPTVGVDPQSRRAILDMIKELNQEGMTVLYTSHYMEEVSELCHSIAIMDRGKIIAQDSLDGLYKLVGEQDVLRLELKAPLASQAFLAELPGVAQVAIDGKEVVITAADGNCTLAAAITALIGQNQQVLAVKLEKPNLEAVFLHLTGRSLRD